MLFSSNVDPSELQVSRHKARAWCGGGVGDHAQEPLLVRDAAEGIEGHYNGLPEVVSEGHETLGRQVASAVPPRRSESVGPVEELVGQSRLSLVVDLQARGERVRVENRVGTDSCRRGVLPDPEDNPEPVSVVIQGKVGLPTDEDALERQLCDGNLVANSRS